VSPSLFLLKNPDPFSKTDEKNYCLQNHFEQENEEEYFHPKRTKP
jgi:hypothetical protein